MRFQEIHGGEFDGAFEFEDLDGSITIVYKNTRAFLFIENMYEKWYEKTYNRKLNNK